MERARLPGDLDDKSRGSSRRVTRSLPAEQLVAVSEGLRSGAAREPTSVRVSESDGFSWPSAVIGAVSLLGLVGVSLAVLLGARLIRRRPAQA
jgi:hypothetical protein